MFLLNLLVCLLSITSLPRQDDVALQKALDLKLMYNSYEQALMSAQTESADIIAKSIRLQYDSMDDGLRERVKDCLLNDLIEAFDSKDNDAFMKEANRTLFILPQDDPSRIDIYSTMADIYVAQGSKQRLLSAIDCMKASPLSSQPVYAGKIDSLAAAADKMVLLQDIMQGYWFSDLHYHRAKDIGGQLTSIHAFTSAPAVVLKINYGVAELTRLSHLVSEPSDFMGLSNPYIKYSDKIYYGPWGDVFDMRFYNRRFSGGNQQLANTILEQSQQTRAEFHALAKDPRATLGQSVATELLGGVVAGGMNSWAISTATPVSNSDEMVIVGNSLSPDVLSCHMMYQQVSVNGMYGMTGNRIIFNNDTNFYRWRKEDNIVFGTIDAKPVSPYVKKLTKDMELYQIKHDTRYWQWKYWKHSLVLLGLGTASAALGAFGFTHLTSESDVDDGLVIASSTIGIMGTLLFFEFALFRNGFVRDRDRAHVVGAYNERQYEKLRQLYPDSRE